MTKELFTFIGIKFFPALVNFMLVPLIYQKFGSKVYGEYSLILTVIFLIITLTSGLLLHSTYRFYKEENVGRYVMLSLSISVFSSLLFLLFSLAFSDNSLPIIIISAILILLATSYTLFLVLAQMKLGKGSVLKCESLRVFILFLFVCVYENGNDSDLAIFSLLSMNTISFLLPIIFFLTRGLYFKYTKLSISWIIEHFKFGILISTWLAISSLAWLINRLYISSNFDEHMLGYYSSLFDIVYKCVSLLGAGFSMMLYPKVSSLLSNKKPVIEVIRKSSIIFIIISIVSINCAYFFGAYILNYLFDEDFLNYEIVFILLPLLIYQLSIILQKPIEISGRVLPLVYLLVLSVALHLSLIYLCSIISIPLFYTLGIAGLGSSFQYFFGVLILYKKFKVK